MIRKKSGRKEERRERERERKDETSWRTRREKDRERGVDGRWMDLRFGRGVQQMVQPFDCFFVVFSRGAGAKTARIASSKTFLRPF